MSVVAQLKRFQKKQFFRFYMELHKPGIVAFVNEKDSRVYIAPSQNVAVTIATITRQLVNKWHTNKQFVRDRKRLQILVVELSESSIKNQKLRVYTCAKEFLAKGYTLYNPSIIPSYTPKIKVTEDAKVHVVLESRGKRNLLVQEFGTYIEAEEYIKVNTTEDMLSKALTE